MEDLSFERRETERERLKGEKLRMYLGLGLELEAIYTCFFFVNAGLVEPIRKS
jgi:hypothetical protein